MKCQPLKFFLLFCFLFFMSTMIATGKVLPRQENTHAAGPVPATATR